MPVGQPVAGSQTRRGPAVPSCDRAIPNVVLLHRPQSSHRQEFLHGALLGCHRAPLPGASRPAADAVAPPARSVPTPPACPPSAGTAAYRRTIRYTAATTPPNSQHPVVPTTPRRLALERRPAATPPAAAYPAARTHRSRSATTPSTCQNVRW